MDDDRGGDAESTHEEEHEQPVIGAAALGDGHDGEVRHAALRRHAGADHGLGHRRQRVDEQARQDAGDEAERGKTEHGGEREAVRLMRAPCGFGARAAEEGDAEGLDETGRGESCGERKQRADRGDEELQAPGGICGLCRMAWKVSHSETKPFSGGSAEMATQPTRKVKAVSGMR